MPDVTVLYKSEKKPVIEKGEKNLQWYDSIRGEMLVFHGGKLGFEYKEDEYIVKMSQEERTTKDITSTFRMLPKVEDVKVVNYSKTRTTTNEKVVRKWFDDYLNYNITDASIVGEYSYGITVSVSDREMDDFLYQAERNGLRTTKND